MRLRSFLVGLAGGVVGAGLLVLALFLLGVTDVTRTESVKVLTPSGYQATDGTTSGGLTPTQIYNRSATGVAEVFSTFAPTGTDFFGQPTGGGQGLGSGFVVSKDGFILTNAHVVSDQGQQAQKVTVAFKGANSQVKKVDAKVVGIDQSSDVAVLKIDPKGLTLNPLPLGDSDAVQVGEPVVAIGNPLGFDFSLSSGIVSAVRRNLAAPNGAAIPNGIQTDAAINPGNSGGPLIDAVGRVIGINEQIATTGQSTGNEGLGFAVPINTAKSAMESLIKTGKVEHAFLGIGMASVSPDVAAALNLAVDHGVFVTLVQLNSPAAKAGLSAGTGTATIQGQQYPVGGDIITAIDGKQIAATEDFQAAMASYKPGDTVTLTVQRGDKSREVKATLAQWPDNLQPNPQASPTP